MAKNKNKPTVPRATSLQPTKRSTTTSQSWQYSFKTTPPNAQSAATSATPAKSDPANTEVLKSAVLEAIDKHHTAWAQLPEGNVLRVERRGEPVAVVMAYDDFEALLERLEDLEDMHDARKTFEAIERGEETTIPHEQLRAELIAEGLLDD